MKKEMNDNINAKLEVLKVFAYKESGWCSFRAKDEDGRELHCAGIMTKEPKRGEKYIVEAEAKQTRYGTQYDIKSAAQAVPEDVEGILKYLCDGHIKGIGKVTAQKLVDEFGAETLDVIHNNPERLLEMRGISSKKLEKIIQSSAENRSIEGIYKITKGAVTRLQAKKLFDTYGKDAVDKLKEDPYKTLTQLDNIGFLSADRVALGCGIEEFATVRTTNAVLYVLTEVVTVNGDCYVPITKMEQEAILLLNKLPAWVDKIRGAKKTILEKTESYDYERPSIIKNLRLDAEQVKELDAWFGKRNECISAIADAILTLISQDEIYYDDDREVIAAKRIRETELAIADMIRDMTRDNGVYVASKKTMMQYVEDCEKKGNVFNEEQKDAFFKALSNKLSILTGGPGCGKTTSIALVAGFWRKMGGEVFLMAPTGRAAQRVKESMKEQLPDSSFPTSTIHYMLANENARNEMEEVDKDKVLVICDESSMVDIRLAYSLLKLTKDYRVVLVGDSEQLPPVGAGNFFRDVIASGKVPTTWLVKNYRSTGNIVANAQKIRIGDTKLATGSDFRIMGVEREFIPREIVKQYMAFLEIEGTTIRDISILTLQRKRGVSSVFALNRAVQAAYNPELPEKPEYKMQDFSLRLGDRVIHTKNNYAMTRTLNGKKSVGVFNGDLGVITAFNPDFLEGEGDDEWVLRVKFDDGSEAYYKELDLLQLELAYAMTVHKAQGSEFKYVIGTYAMDQYTMLFRAIAYTSATRAKLKYVTIAETRAFYKAIGNVGSTERNTFLKELMVY